MKNIFKTLSLSFLAMASCSILFSAVTTINVSFIDEVGNPITDATCEIGVQKVVEGKIDSHYLQDINPFRIGNTTIITLDVTSDIVADFLIYHPTRLGHAARYIITQNSEFSKTVSLIPAIYSIDGQITQVGITGSMTVMAYRASEIADLYAASITDNPVEYAVTASFTKVVTEGVYSVPVNTESWWIGVMLDQTPRFDIISSSVSVPPSVSGLDYEMVGDVKTLSINVVDDTLAALPGVSVDIQAYFLELGNQLGSRIGDYSKKSDSDGYVVVNIPTTQDIVIQLSAVASANYDYMSFLKVQSQPWQKTITLDSTNLAISGTISRNHITSNIDVMAFTSSDVVQAFAAQSSSNVIEYEIIGAYSKVAENGTYSLDLGTGDYWIAAMPNQGSPEIISASAKIPPSISNLDYVMLGQTLASLSIRNLSTTVTYNTIQDALDAASAGQMIGIGPGVYTGTGNVNLVWPNTPEITLIGTGSSANVIIDGQGTSRHIIQNNAIRWGLTNLSLINGAASGQDGGSIYIAANSSAHNVSINSCIISGNIASRGGAIAAGNDSNIYIGMSRIINNSASSYGGAIYEGQVTSVYSSFVGNSADRGAVYCVYNERINNNNWMNSQFKNNSAVSIGGVFYSGSGMNTMMQSIFEGNTAKEGAVVYNGNNIINTVINCIISGNRAIGSPSYGGVFKTGDNRIFNSLLLDNRAGSEGGVFFNGDNLVVNSTIIHVYGAEIYYDYNEGGGSDNGEFEAHNSIFTGRFDSAFNVSTLSTVTLNYCIVTDNSLSSYINTSNLISGFTMADFVDPSNGDYHLVTSSVGVNTGSNSAWSSYSSGNVLDFEGNARIVGSAIDIGPYELAGAGASVTTSILPDGYFLYVANENAGSSGPSIVKIDSNNNASTIGTGFSGASGLAVHPESGDLYISDDNNKIYQYDKDQATLNVVYTGLANPNGLGFSDTSILLIAEAGSSIKSLNLTNNTLEDIATGFGIPQAVAFHGDNLFFTANDGYIYKVAHNDSMPITYPATANRYTSSPVVPGTEGGIVIDSAGNIYASDYNGSVVMVATGSQQVSTVFYQPGIQTRGLALTPSENYLLISDFGNQQIIYVELTNTSNRDVLIDYSASGGRFAGPFGLTITTENYGSFEIDSNSGNNLFQLVLNVLDSSSLPLANADINVEVEDLQERQSIRFNTVADTLGRVTINYTATKDLYVTVTAEKPGYVKYNCGFRLNRDRSIVKSIKLPSISSTISGTIYNVWDQPTGNIGVLALRTSQFAEMMELMSTVNRSDIEGPFQMVTTDINGNYNLNLYNETWVVALMEDGPPAFLTLNATIPPSIVSLDYVLGSKLITLNGLVEDQFGSPVPGVLVGALKMQTVEIDQITDIMRKDRTFSDGSGVYTLRMMNHPSRDYGIVAAKQGYMSSVYGSRSTTADLVSLNLTLPQKIVTVSGMIVSNNIPVNQDLFISFVQEGVTSNSIWMAQFFSVVTGNGSYEIAIATGNYKVGLYTDFINGPSHDMYNIYSRSINVNGNMSGVTLDLSTTLTMNLQGTVRILGGGVTDNIVLEIRKEDAANNDLGRVTYNNFVSVSGTYNVVITGNFHHFRARFLYDAIDGYYQPQSAYKFIPLQGNSTFNLDPIMREKVTTFGVTIENLLPTIDFHIAFRAANDVGGGIKEVVFQNNGDPYLLNTQNTHVDVPLPTGDYKIFVFNTPTYNVGDEYIASGWYTVKTTVGMSGSAVTLDWNWISQVQDCDDSMPNRASTISIISPVITTEGQTLILSPVVTDPDGDSPSIEYFGWMTTNTRIMDYNESGTYNISIVADDSKLNGRVTKDVVIVVKELNDYPVFMVGTEDIRVSENSGITVSIIAADPDDEGPVTYSIQGKPSTASFNVFDGTFSWYPGLTDAGIYPITVNAYDSFGLLTKVTLDIFVIDVNGHDLTEAVIGSVEVTGDNKLIGIPMSGISLTLNNSIYFWNPNLNGPGFGGYETISSNIPAYTACWIQSSSNITINVLDKFYDPGNKGVSLKKGWNMFTNPQLVTINFQNVLVSANNLTYTVTAAVQNNLIANGLFSYDGNQYQTNAEMLPWVGYWIKAYQGVTLLIPSRNVAPMADIQGAALGVNKSLKLAVSIAGKDINLVGSEFNSAFNDLLSAPAAPGQIRSLDATKFGRNYQQSSQELADIINWEIVFNTDRSGYQVFKLQEVANDTSEAYEYFLKDSQNHRTIKFINGEARVYVLDGKNQYTLQAINSSIQSLSVTNVINYPNPFNPNNNEKSKIAWSGTGSASVDADLSIYSITGKRIRRIMATAKLTSDYFEWDGSDEAGHAMPNDVYFYILKLTNDSGESKKLKGKITLWRK